ncbi:D-alanyl-D-alanine carboxypeptidase family protein [Ancylobacter sp. Lp-2]|uniref:M15 family metallopeptidase n=1 Tax=Ancylobacter sp. Lp-2 TaxID=2881339 RepID=UPI001E4F9A90|nr:D-alanyl-D-alanine carboxypeptidase family protein [Ancylobacter sp. Lp-2]MCB4771811.1 D-alanyl-D-alanine carboxypeptidase family protein [Ancylobacter sp. Lp-2]
MASSAGAVFVDLGLSSASFHSGLQKAGKDLDGFGKDAKRTGGIARAALAGVGDGLRAGLAGLTIAGAFAGLKAVTSDLAQLNAEAKRAGVGAEAFQELAYAAKQSRVGLDALTDGLKELQLRADEFVVTGQGSAAEAFQRLGYTAEDLGKKLAEPDKLFEEIIDKLAKLDRASQIRIADELFGGTGGEQFVQLLDRGVGSVAKLRQEARDTGNVISQEMIDKAVELDRQFDKIANTVSTSLRSALVGVVNVMSQFVDMLGDVGNQSTSTIQKRLDLAKAALPKYKSYGFSDAYIAEREAEIKQLEDELARRPKAVVTVNARPAAGAGDKMAGLDKGFQTNLQSFIDSANTMGFNIGVTSGFRTVERQQQLWNEALKKYGSVAEARKWVAPPGSSNHNKGQAADLSFGSDAARQWAHDNAKSFGLNFPLSNENWHIEPAGARGGESQADAYKDVVSSANERIRQMQIEQQALGMTTQAAAAYRFEQDLLAEAQRQGIELTPEHTAGLHALAQQYGNLQAAASASVDAQHRAAEAVAEVNSIGRDVIGGVISDLRAGADGAEVFANALSRVADRLVDIGLNALFPTNGSGGLLGSLFGSLFGGAAGFSSGGYTGSGGKYQPAGMVHKGEYVFDQASVRAAGGPGALDAMRRGLKGYASGGYVGSAPTLPNVAGVARQAPSMSFHTTVDASGSTVSEAQIRAIVAEGNRQTVKQVRRSVSGWTQDDAMRAPARPGTHSR